MLTSGPPAGSGEVPRTSMSQGQSEPGCFWQSTHMDPVTIRYRDERKNSLLEDSSHCAKAGWGHARGIRCCHRLSLSSHNILTPGLHQASLRAVTPQIQQQQVLERPRLRLNSLEPSFSWASSRKPKLYMAALGQRAQQMVQIHRDMVECRAWTMLTQPASYSMAGQVSPMGFG